MSDAPRSFKTTLPRGKKHLAKPALPDVAPPDETPAENRLRRLERVVDASITCLELAFTDQDVLVDAAEVKTLLQTAFALADRIEGLHRAGHEESEGVPESMRMLLAKETGDEQVVIDAFEEEHQELYMMAQALNPRRQAEYRDAVNKSRSAVTKEEDLPAPPPSPGERPASTVM